MDTLQPRRVESVDILRGFVMIIMAIDHVRVYSGMPAGGPDAAIFFTRWITHFCAPAFCFYAGTSAFLYYSKMNSLPALRKFLLTRGILLVVLELTVVRFFWTFNLNLNEFMLAGVIWMLGWCMILMALVMSKKPVVMLIVGSVIVVGQSAFGYVPLLFPGSIRQTSALWWSFFYQAAPGVAEIPGDFGMVTVYGLTILYVLLPWLGVMLLGFAFGNLVVMDHTVVKKWCLRIGITLIVVFVLLAVFNATSNPNDQESPFIFRVLGQQKYPPSINFLLMTLAPLIALTPWAEKWKGKIADAIRIVGRVPMFFYLAHILVIHLSALLLNAILFGAPKGYLYHSAPLLWMEEADRWGLLWLYVVWLIDVVILYFLCRWYVGFKQRNSSSIVLKYI